MEVLFTMNKKTLLNLARRAIEARLFKKNLEIKEEEKKFITKQACFVTLTINGELRGCIGHLEPIQELYKEVAANATAAAFEDPRFPPLCKAELDRIKIEISILGKKKKLEYKTVEELKEYLERNRPGVVLKKGWQNATFLPQVWEELPEVEEFLGYLCTKAGLKKDEWKHGVEIEVYGVDKIVE